MSLSRKVTKVFGGVEIVNFIDSNNQPISHVGTPIEPSDAANKYYVDASINSINNSIENITIIAGDGLTEIDNVFNVNNNLPNLSGVGTIQTGTWAADSISVNYGGTGTTSFSPNKFIIGNGVNPLQSYGNIEIHENYVIFDTKIKITNTENAQSTNGSLIVSGGINIAKDALIGGNITAYNATIQNLAVPGSINISTVNAYSSNFTNLTVGNFNSNNNILNNVLLTNVSGTSLVFINSTSSNSYVNNATINNIYIPSTLYCNVASTSNLIFTSATGKSFYISNFTASNTTILNSSISSSIISSSTAASIYITNCTNTNLYSQNGYFLNSNNTNFTCNNGFLINITASNIYANFLRSNNSVLNNTTIQNALISNCNVNNNTSTNLLTSNANILLSTINNLYCTNNTISNLNVDISTLNNIISNNISTNNLISNTQSSYLSNNINTISINNTLSSVYSNLVSSSSILSSNLNSTFITGASLNCINSNLTNSTINTLHTLNIYSNFISNSTTNSININASKSNFINTYITNASLLYCNISQSTIGTLSVNDTLSLKKSLNIGSNYNSRPFASSGALLTTNSINFIDNITLSRSSKWFSTYFSKSTLSALNPNIITGQAATVYIQGKPIAGTNQTIEYSTNLALGYVTNTTGGNLTGQIMFERNDGSWFSSIYVDSSNKFILNNASSDINSGIGLYVYNNVPITFATIPNVSNITPTDFIRFTSVTSTFYSTVDSTNLSSASVVFNGGISIQKTLNVQNNAIIPNITNNNLSSTNISASSLNLSLGITTANINFTGNLYQNGLLYISSQWTTTNGNLFYTSGNIGIYNTAPTCALDISGGVCATETISSGALATSRITSNYINCNNSISAATLMISSGITTSNINFTGNLYKNGILYISSQWTTTNGNLFYTSGNIGIYNTAPTCALDISGGVRLTETISSGALATTRITSNQINSTNATFGNINANIMNLQTGLTTSNINFTGNLYKNGILYVSSQWTTTNGNLFYTSGNIGIYTTAPTCALDVSGGANITGNLSVGTLLSNNISTSNLYAVNYSSTNLTVSNLILNNFTSSNLVVNNINFGTSNYFSGSVNGINNVITPINIGGLSFSNNEIVSFNANITIVINTMTNNLYENFSLQGIYTESGWTLCIGSFGDISGINFSITSSGQIQYTSTDIDGYISSTIRFTVNQTSMTGSYSSLVKPTEGNTYIYDSIQLTNTTDAVPNTSNGCAFMAGGLSIKKSIIADGNIYSGSGIIGPSFLLQNRYIDANNVGIDFNSSFTAANSIIFTEPGNPGIYGAVGGSNGFGTNIISNACNDSINWNYARLIIRGVSLNTGTTGSSVFIQPYILENKTLNMNTQNNFVVADNGSDCGYCTWISPWIPTNSINDIQSLGIKVLGITTGNTINTGSVRIGPTYLQFSC